MLSISFSKLEEEYLYDVVLSKLQQLQSEIILSPYLFLKNEILILCKNFISLIIIHTCNDSKILKNFIKFSPLEPEKYTQQKLIEILSKVYTFNVCVNLLY